ncbi:hypothetical protein PENTCL1PPCAC_30251 [Pristionchus entomophagus]|uniref:G protein-coupled receptor n=1 Tax=Pristionchus entomophagus TaxID=358040 RepID=A0AAV5UPL2_9BILA|nr:hypothetical protein PENTCL1PPCAC_25252 [Pristionchus entomophagus]GMT08078.1 hypothetical protein PENTCL1PPCAC_30251 [Pristionchus entomophagus]
MHGHSHSHHDEDTVSIIDWLNDSVLDSVMGCTMLVTNMTIFIVIKMRKTIEKEYCLLATLVCFNSLFGAMFIYQAYYNTMFAETAHIVHDRWSCIKYLAVTHPIYYYRLDKNCAKLLALIVTLLFIIITSTLCTVGLIFGPAHVHCHPLDFFSNAANASFMSCGWIGHLVSVLLYFAVIRHLKHQHSCSVVLRECQKCSDHGFVSIRRMFAVFATITLILVVIPVAVMAGHELLVCFRWTHDHLSPEELHAHSHNSHTYFRLVLKISTVNPTINVVFYALRHKQVYIGVREMFSRKVSKTSAVPTRGLLQKLGTKISGQSV